MNEKDNNSTVTPGEKIAVIEEYIPDSHCYEIDGVIYSNITGNVEIDNKKHKIQVKPDKGVITAAVGQIGIGRVEFCRKQVANIDLHFLGDRKYFKPISTSLHVSETSKKFIKSMYEVVRAGDWIKIRVISTARNIYSTLIGDDSLGVILAYCINCGTELEYKRRNQLKCPNCELEQYRITSRNYGKEFSFFEKSE